MSTSVKVRASSLAELFDCPARWAAKHIDGKFIPSTGKSVLGTAVHASTAAYDKARMDNLELSIDDVAGIAVDTIKEPGREVLWEDDLPPAQVEKIALSLNKKYCTYISPTQNYKAVEVECEALEISDLGIILTGTTDRIRETEEGFGVSDLKTGKAVVGSDGIVNTKGHGYQMGVYELLAEHASGLPITAPAEIIGMNTAKTEASQRTGTGFVSYAREVLLGSDEYPGILQTASTIIHRGIFWGNPKSMMCHERYCPNFKTCSYRK